jgi:hypothetical protein
VGKPNVFTSIMAYLYGSTDNPSTANILYHRVSCAL